MQQPVAVDTPSHAPGSAQASRRQRAGGAPEAGHAATPPRARRREPFLDVFRGYALVAITLNHFTLVAHDEGVAGARSFTLTPIGLSSAAEIFVLCSGCAFALAYGRLIERSGLREAWPKALRRAGLLMLCNLLMTVLSASVITLCIPVADRFRGSFKMAGYVFGDPLFMLKEMLLLQWRPAYHDVLPLYALLLGLGPLLLFGLRHRPALTVSLSAGLWLLAATGVVTTERIGLAGWYFHPLAWQFLFLLGMLAARLEAPARVPRSRTALGVYAALLTGSFAFKIAAHHGVVPPDLRIGLGDGGAVPLDDKLTLGPLRIAHVLLLAASLAALYRRLAETPQHLLDRTLGRIGRSTLPAFVASNPLMFLAGGLLAAAPSTRLFYLLCAPLAASLLLFVLVWQRRARPALPQLQPG